MTTKLIGFGSLILLQLGCAAAPPPPSAPPPPPAPIAPPDNAVNTAAPTRPAAQPPAATEASNPKSIARITVTNPATETRKSETVVIQLEALEKLVPHIDLKQVLIVDAAGKPVLSQVVDSDGNGSPDQVLFQTDLTGKETKAFEARLGERHYAKFSDYKAYGRFVRERFDDFAWENDLVAHRMYGPALETAQKEPLTSSGIDVWTKRVPKLVVNEWYMTDDYHADSGEGADFYGVGKSRGCGGLGFWSNSKLATSRNFTTSRVLANGPIRLVFELTYAPWEATKGVKVSETKRVTLDAGSQFNQFESTFTRAGKTPLTVGIGIAKHAGSTVQAETETASIRTWEPLKGLKGEESGNLGCAIVLAPGSKIEQQATDLEYLAVTPLPANGKLAYLVGSAWDRAGRVRDAAAWAADVKAQAARMAAPAQVTVTAAK